MGVKRLNWRALTIGATIGALFCGVLWPRIAWRLDRAALLDRTRSADRGAQINRERSERFLRRFAAAPRVSGDRGLRRGGDLILAELQSIGLRGERRLTLYSADSRGGLAQIAELDNIVVRIRGGAVSGQDRPALLLMAHYDSAPGSPGASDDGAGVTAILATLQALFRAGLIERGPDGARLRGSRLDLIALFTDGEERGLLGARTFLEQDPLAGEIVAVVNLEARGISGPPLLFQYGPSSGSLLRATLGAGVVQMHSFSNALFPILPYGTDYQPFLRRGVAGVNLAYIEGPQHYHNALDSLEYIDFAAVFALAEAALASVQKFSTTYKRDDSLELNALAAGALRLMVPESALRLFSALCAIACGWLALRRWRQERPRPWPLIRALSGWLAPWLLFALVALLLWRSAVWLFPALAARSVSGEICTGEWLKWAYLFLMFAAATAWHRWRRKPELDRAAATAALLALTVAAIFSVFVEGAAFAAALPIALGAPLFGLALRAEASRFGFLWALALIPLAFALGLLLSLLHFALALSGVAMFTVLPAAAFVFLLAPVLNQGEGRGPMASWLFLSVGAILLIAGYVLAPAQCPAQNSLMLASDPSGERAQWLSCDGRRDEYLRRTLGAADDAGGLLLGEAPFCWPFGEASTAPAPLPRLPAPTMTRSVQGGVSEILVQSERSAPHLLLVVDHKQPLGVNYKNRRLRLEAGSGLVSAGEGRSLLLLSSSPQPGGPFVLEIRGSYRALTVLDHSPGLPEGMAPPGRQEIPGGRFPWNDGVFVRGTRLGGAGESAPGSQKD